MNGNFDSESNLKDKMLTIFRFPKGLIIYTK